MIFIYFFFLNGIFTDSVEIPISKSELSEFHIVAKSKDSSILYAKGMSDLYLVNFLEKSVKTISYESDISSATSNKQGDVYILWEMENKVSVYDHFFELKDEFRFDDNGSFFSEIYITSSNHLILYENEYNMIISYNLLERSFLNKYDLSFLSDQNIGSNYHFRSYDNSIILVGDKHSFLFNSYGFYLNEIVSISSDFYKKNNQLIVQNNYDIKVNDTKSYKNILTFDVYDEFIVLLTKSGKLVRAK